MTYKILIASRSFGSTSSKPWDVLKRAGCEIVQVDISNKITEQRMAELLQGIDGAIIGVVPMTTYVLEHAPSLKVVSMHGVGVDHIDLSAAAQRGVVIANCQGTNDQSVADLTIGLMIAVARDIPAVDRAVRGGGWGAHAGSELWKKTLGLVGLGRIGRGVAKRALGFEMNVLAYDPYVQAENLEAGVSMTDLHEVLKEADFVSLHASLSGETRHMIGMPQLQIMKPSAYLINTSRGALVDERALYSALQEKQIAGAALDVYDVEPPKDSPLLQLENIVVTPHIGAHTRESIERVGVMSAENVLWTLQGGQPHHRVA
ncbi:MAG TPA: phosphoglycerate dehydrogenase [Anaerolineales bacterium]|nr:phosphoglycerate dehydrogenase [Anaerolineales bacterium]